MAYPVATRRQDLLADPPDGEDVSAQRDLARHGHVRAHAPPAHGRQDRRGHRHAGGRAILRDRTFRHVDVYVHFFPVELAQTERPCLRAQIAHCSLRGLLHHIAQTACQEQLALAPHRHGLDHQHVAPGLRPREPHDDPPLRRSGDGEVVELGRAKMILQVLHLDRHGQRERVPFVLRLDEATRDLTDDRRQRAVQPAHAGLPRVGRHDLLQHGHGDLHVPIPEAMFLQVARQKIARGDLDLLLRDVPRQGDDLHPIEQRLRDRMRHVGRGDEQHLAEVEGDLEVVVRERGVLLRV